MSRRRYCFTLNNFTPSDVERLESLGTSDCCKYLVYGRERGDSGTPHLQGFIIFSNSVSFSSAKSKLGNSCHIEAARGTSNQAADYCKKDGEYTEHGELSEQGKRSDWDVYRDWVVAQGRIPSRLEICVEFPSLYARYKRACIEYAEAIAPRPVLVDGTPRFGWQTRVAGIMEMEPDDRKVVFVVDPDGNSGKSWMCRYAMTKWPDRTQVLRIGKRDDLAHAIDIDKSLILVDVPRGQMTFLQYSVLESLKDRLLFSPKYDSQLKIMRSKVTVIVFSNESPDETMLTSDRFEIINI